MEQRRWVGMAVAIAIATTLVAASRLDGASARVEWAVLLPAVLLAVAARLFAKQR